MEQPIQDLRVTLVQSELAWHNPAANHQAFKQQMAGLKGKTDLIILPEMFTTGFTMTPEQVAENWLDSLTVDWMKQQASDLDAALCGSVVIQQDEQHFNRMLLVMPEGNVHHYDKRHLFRMAREHEHYTAGSQRAVVNYRGWRILLQVCYDLRFPVFSRNQNDYDLAVYVANWPQPRRAAWRTLLQARAIENLAYVVGVNRVGEDSNGNPYSGDSAAIDFKGDVLVDHAAGTVFVETSTLTMKTLQAFRDKFPAWQDADGFELRC